MFQKKWVRGRLDALAHKTAKGQKWKLVCQIFDLEIYYKRQEMMSVISQPSIRTRNPSAATSKMGQIQIIFGPMFSGKSTELIRRLKRYQIARYSCLIVKYARDVRYGEAESIATHDLQTLKAVSATNLFSLGNVDDYDVIGIDEGQFFPDVRQFCEQMADSGKTVIVAALDATFQRKAFEEVVNLVPLAEHVVKLTAVCMNCFGEGSYTKRISDDKEVEVIGGAEKYMAVCRRCYHAPVTMPSSPRTPFKVMDNVEWNGHIILPKKALFEEKEAEN